MLSGINRQDPANLVTDGSAREIVNLRPKDGAYRPVGTKTANISEAGDIAYIHEIDQRFKTILFWDATGEVWKYTVYDNGDAGTTQTLTGLTIPTLKTVSALNSTLILVFESAGVLTSQRLIFNKDTELYKVVGSLPAVPFCSIASEAVPADNAYSYVFRPDTQAKADEAAEAILNTTLKVMNADKGEDYYTGPVMIMLAWELMDGSEIKQTIPIWWTGSQLSIVSVEDVVCPVTWAAYALRLTTTMNTEDLYQIVNDYTGIVAGLNIYATKMVAPTRGDATFDDSGKIVVPSLLPTFPSYSSPDSLHDETLFYLVKKIPLANLVTTLYPPAATPGYILEGPFADLSTRQSVGVNQFSHHDIAFRGSFSYNNRVFGFDVDTKLFKGFSLDGYINGSLSSSGGNSYYLGAEIDINTNSGVKTVFTGWGSALNYYSSSSYSIIQFFFNKFYGYPDSRATTLRLFCKNNLGVIYKLRTYSMVRIESFNYSVMAGGYESLLSYLLSSLTPTALNTVDDTHRDANRVQATGLDNIFKYPAENSYRIGSGKVLGISSNAIALSQGQFGEYPLYCFTTEGVWAMMMGSGDILIDSVKPLLRDVCNNPSSIRQIDGGVIYTTANGLMLLSGSQSQELSVQVEGEYASPLRALASYGDILCDKNIANVKTYLCSTDILTYLSGAHIGYDYIENEIICSNASYSYSWVFNLNYKAWHKVSEAFTGFVDSYPICYGKRLVDGVCSLYNVTQEDYNGDVPVMLETREVKYTGGGYKKLVRSLIGCIVSHDDIDNRVSVQVFGSPEPGRWYRLSCSNIFGSLADFLLGRSPFSCRYFIYLISGKVENGSLFTHIEADLDIKFSRKLR